MEIPLDSRRAETALIMALLAVAGAPAPLRMTAPPPVRSGVTAYPRILAPADDAQRRINAAVARLDARVAAAARDCLTDSTERRGSWERQVDVTMHGPEFVSYLVTDDVDCGSAHPDQDHSAIVYDLRTGAPVDWTKLLPPALTGTLALTDGEDGVRVVTLASPRLFALYRAGYDHGGDADEEKECRDAIASAGGDGPVPLLAWLDARAGGLALRFDLGHAEEACSEPVVIPIAALRREGASPRLLDALTAAHAAAAARSNKRGHS